MDGCSNIHGRRIAIILTAMVLLLVLTTTPRLAVASPVQATCKDVMTVDLDFINTSILRETESIIILQNLCRDMIRGTKLVLVQTALATITKFILNQIQEARLYRVINHSTI